MEVRVRFHAPRWPWYERRHGRVHVWHIPLERPLSRVFWVWEAPALRAYHPAVRAAFLSLVRESQPNKLAKLRALGFRLGEEVHLDGLITSMEGLTHNVSAALDLVYRLWAEVPLSEGALRPIVERLSQERQRAWAYPSFRAHAYLKKHLWDPTYALYAPLSPAEIQTLSAAEVRRFYEEILHKSLRHIVVLAPTLPPSLSPWLEWQGDLSYRLEVYTPSWGWYADPDESAQQASLRIAYPGLRRNHPQYPLYRLALTHLGGYFGSRLMQEIREKGGYTYGIYARTIEAWGGSYFTIESEIDKARAPEALQKILDIVSGWAESPFPDEETLIETRNYLIARLSPETPGDWAGIMAHSLLHGYTPDHYLQTAERISTLEYSDYDQWEGSRLGKLVGGILVGSPAPIFVA